MSSKSFDEVKVGLFVLISALVIMVFIFALGGRQSFFPNYYHLYARFDDISGLRVGAPLQLAGVHIGFVDRIKFSRDPADKKITVSLKVMKGFRGRIRADSFASINTQGLLGDKYISVTVGSPDQPELKSDAIIAVRESRSIFEFGEKASDTLENISSMAESIRRVVEQLEGRAKTGELKDMIDSVKKTIDRAEKGPGMLHALLYDPKGEQVVASLNDILRSTDKVMREAEKQAPGNLGGILVNLKASSADLRRILASLKQGEGTAGKLIMDPGLYDDLRALFGGLSRRRMLRTVIRQTIDQEEAMTKSQGQAN